MENLATKFGGAGAVGWQISPLVGEMGGSPEGGAVPLASQPSVLDQFDGGRSTLPPSALPGISPTRGEIGSSCGFAVTAESGNDVAAREALLDRAMGAGRKRKSSEKLRRGRKPSEGLAFVARDADGRIVGTVRLWDVAFSSSAAAATLPSGGRKAAALLLGPLAVDPTLKGAGIGSMLMYHAIEEARRLGHGAILLVGDASYYGRFGFSTEKTVSLAMPGPYELHRFLALELKPGALDGAHGVISATGRKSEQLRSSGRTSNAA